MQGEMEGETVLVTGAGQGCGRVLAEDFAARGASVVVNDVNSETGRETVDRIQAAGGNATFVLADVGIEEQVAELANACLSTYGVSTRRSTTREPSCP